MSIRDCLTRGGVLTGIARIQATKIYTAKIVKQFEGNLDQVPAIKVGVPNQETGAVL